MPEPDQHQPPGSGHHSSDLELQDGSRVVVDIYEPRDFTGVGPASCNMCGGIISESLVQNLAAEGINLPSSVVQRGIDSYILHMDVGTVRIETPLNEMRIGAVHRAAGPKDLKAAKWESFDGFLQRLAVDKGACLNRLRIEEIGWRDERPVIRTRDGWSEPYDLLVVAAGVNSPTLKLFGGSHLSYEPPKTTKTFIREFFVGPDRLAEYLGSSMHVFLLNIPGLEFAAIIPKGDYASICLLGEDIDKAALQSFLDSQEVKDCMPPGWESSVNSCQCSPRMAIRRAVKPYDDRVVFVGDAGVTRLYKDGIGAAYRTSKGAASTAVLHGVSRRAFEKHYEPVCRGIESDNSIGRFVFWITGEIQKRGFARNAVLRSVAREQSRRGGGRHLSMVLWDLFTGSATYREIFKRALHPGFIVRFAWDLSRSIVMNPKRSRRAA
jgi:flavin-dependent dehydrogenase